MSNEEFYNLVVRYLSRESTEKEAEQLQLLLKIDIYQDEFNKICRGWVSIKDPAKFVFYDAKWGLKRLEEKIRTAGKNNIKKVLSGVLSKTNVLGSNIFRVSFVFSLLALLLISLMHLLNGVQKEDKITAWIEKSTVNGERLIIDMIDGTRIVLNADSQIKYPVQIGSYSRDVYLKGEAFFQVTHNESKPFIVHSANLTTTVLGTVFNVSSFEKENEIKVSLVSGVVKVSGNDLFKSKGSVLLKPSQQFVFNKNNYTGTVGVFDQQKEIGWKDNILIFNNEPLETVFIELKRTFGVEFEVSKKSLKSKKITTNLKNESLWTVTEVIKKLTGLEYKKIKMNNQLVKIIYY